MKQCSSCKKTKTYSEFYSKQRKTLYPDSIAGISSDCKKCIVAKHQHKHRISPLNRKANELRHSFNIEIEDYNQMFASQEGMCGICQKHQTELSRYMAVDHDHNTGKIRGLLCSACNVGLGMFKDNLNLLNSAVEYLNLYSELADTESNVVDLTISKKGG